MTFPMYDSSCFIRGKGWTEQAVVTVCSSTADEAHSVLHKRISIPYSKNWQATTQTMYQIVCDT